MVLDELVPGAYLLREHSVSATMCARLLAASAAFFARPVAERAAIAMLHSPHFRGYSEAGSEYTAGQPDQREELDVGPELPARDLDPHDPPYERIHGPNQWPASLPEFRPLVLAWMAQMRPLAEATLRVLLQRAGLPADALDAQIGALPHERLKIVRYPGLATPAGQGVGAHSDSGLITLILAGPGPGLAVRAGDGWLEVEVMAPTLVVLTGRAASAATAGRLPAVVHRVVSPPVGCERISIPYFLNPDLHARVGGEEYGWNALDVLIRSHMDVARRHHPDLVAARERRVAKGDA